MTDDIVTRLRKHHEWFGNGGQPTSIWEDAADEIERLQGEVCRLTRLANLWEAEFNAAVNALTTDRNPT